MKKYTIFSKQLAHIATALFAIVNIIPALAMDKNLAVSKKARKHIILSNSMWDHKKTDASLPSTSTIDLSLAINHELARRRAHQTMLKEQEKQRIRQVRMDSVLDYSDVLLNLFNENAQGSANDDETLRIARDERQQLKKKKMIELKNARREQLEIQLKLEKAKLERLIQEKDQLILERNILKAQSSGTSNTNVNKNVPVAPPVPVRDGLNGLETAVVLGAGGAAVVGVGVGGAVVVAKVGLTAIAQAALAYALTPALATLIL